MALATCLPRSSRKALDLSFRRADAVERVALAAQRRIVAQARTEALAAAGSDEGDVAAAVLDTIFRRGSTTSQQAAAEAVGFAWAEGVATVDRALTARGVTGLPPHNGSRARAVLMAVIRDQVRGAWDEALSRGRLAVRRAVLAGRGAGRELRAVFDELLRQLDRMLLDALTQAFNVAVAERLDELARLGVRGMRKGWAAVNDSRTRATHREAARKYGPCGDPGPIPVRHRFQVGAARLREPRDPRGPAREVINCRCKLVPYVERASRAA